MQVLKISNNYNTNIHNKTNSIENKSTSLQKDGNINLVSPNAFYNQISFKGGNVGYTMPELIKYMGKTIKPFLEETEPEFKKAYDISEKICRIVREFSPNRVEFKPLEFREVKRLRIDELQQNKDEYRYLSDKSDNYYSTKETSDYAHNLYDYFEVPAFLREPYNAYCKMTKDTEHGLQNINLEKLYPELAKKRHNIYEAGSDAGNWFGGYTRAYNMNKRFNEMLEYGIMNIDEYKNTALKAQRSMEEHKEYLPFIEKAVTEAENLYKKGLFTDADYELLNSIPKRAQRVISRNAKRFNDIASKTQLSGNESKQLDEILNKQKELIEDLWNRIEADKKAYFEREAKAKEKWKAEARAEEERLRAEYGDDLPPF